MRIVVISDLHGQYRRIKKLPEGDMLVMAGDFIGSNHPDWYLDFNKWLGELDYKYKVVIAGNHDTLLDSYIKGESLFTNATYLQDTDVNLGGFTIYGSPFTPEWCDWAFMLPRDGEALKSKWELIPKHIDILITHGPPYGILDAVKGSPLGCKHLMNRVIDEIKPLIHIFGHIHPGYGVFQGKNTKYVNASLVDDLCDLVNEPIVLEV